MKHGDLPVQCPSCGSDHIRHARFQSVFERLGSLFGRHPLRCKDCQFRFTSRVWRITDLRFSRCPRCYRTVLSSWSEAHYIPKFWTLVWLRLGAKRLRCEFCRFNFAGFRPVKEVYSSRFRRHHSSDPSAAVAEQDVDDE